MTCGTALKSIRHNEKATVWGCYCFMPIKAMMEHANCWAWEHGISVGWKDELNTDD